MCLLAIQYRLVPEAPILIAANREEFYDRAGIWADICAGSGARNAKRLADAAPASAHMAKGAPR